MSAPASNDTPHQPQPRTEPTRLLRPTTLPPIVLDAGAGGERVDPRKTVKAREPVVISEPERTFSQSSSQTQIFPQENSGSGYSPVLLISLRIAFYLGVITLALMLTLAACKFTNFWDPCMHLFINTTECKVTSYMKGMVYHIDCTEEHQCILPGFQSNTKRQAWSLHKPNDTSAMIQMGSSSENETVDLLNL